MTSVKDCCPGFTGSDCSEGECCPICYRYFKNRFLQSQTLEWSHIFEVEMFTLKRKEAYSECGSSRIRKASISVIFSEPRVFSFIREMGKNSRTLHGVSCS